MTDDHLYLAQRAAEKHIAALDEALYAEDSGEQVEWPESLAPYCGCETCRVREILYAAWPHLQRAADEDRQQLLDTWRIALKTIIASGDDGRWGRIALEALDREKRP